MKTQLINNLPDPRHSATVFRKWTEFKQALFKDLTKANKVEFNKNKEKLTGCRSKKSKFSQSGFAELYAGVYELK